MSHLNRRIAAIEPSATLAVTAKAKQMKADGLDVVSFGAGEPDFATPKHICDAAIAAIGDSTNHKYTPATGTVALKKAIVEKFKRENGLDYEMNQVMSGCGGKHALYNIIMTLIDDGDEVILPAPYWVSYIEMIRLAGGVPVIVSAKEENDFRMTVEELNAAITPKTKMLIFNSPSNPTGTVYSKDEINAIADVLVEKDIWCISDEIYEHLVFEGESYSIASHSKEMFDKTVIANGVAKTFAMTGWRIGYAAGPADVIKAAGGLMGHSTSNPTTVAQVAAEAALNGSMEPVWEMKKAFNERRRIMVDGLREIEGVTCFEPTGAFYAFPNVSKHYGRTLGGIKIVDSLTFSEAALEVAKIAVVPGIAFGEDSCIRMSYATSEENIREGLSRLAKFLA